MPNIKRALLTAGLVLLLPASAWLQDAKPNFTGKWSLDVTKSDFGPIPPPDSMVAVIDHQEPNVKITTTQKAQGEEVVNSRSLTTDGKPNTNKLKLGGGEAEVTSTTTWDGKKLRTSFKLDTAGGPIDVSEALELSEDGKSMILVRDYKSAQGPFSTRVVFNKQ
jgi:hypothetical protein